MTFKTHSIALQISTVIALPVIATAGFIGQFSSLSKCMKIILVGLRDAYWSQKYSTRMILELGKNFTGYSRHYNSTKRFCQALGCMIMWRCCCTIGLVPAANAVSPK